MLAITQTMTAAKLRKMRDIGRCEILYGELVMMSPAGAEHGIVASRLDRILGEYVEANDLGAVFAAETGFLLQQQPDLLRAPDVSFVRLDRISKGAIQGFFKGAPDIAVEVLSPEDSRREVAEKTNTWLAYGSSSVWVADPATMTITRHRTGQPAKRFAANQFFVDPDGMPGLRISVDRVFKMP